MAIITNRWSPDHCGCVVEYTWDDAVPASSRVHNYSGHVTKCANHQSIADGLTAYNAMLEENQRKNKVLGTALSALSTLSQTLANGSVVLKDGVSFNYSFSGIPPNRVVTVSFTGVTLTTQQKNNLQSLADTAFGVGKVVVQ